MHRLTASAPQELRVDLEDFQMNTAIHSCSKLTEYIIFFTHAISVVMIVSIWYEIYMERLLYQWAIPMYCTAVQYHSNHCHDLWLTRLSFQW